MRHSRSQPDQRRQAAVRHLGLTPRPATPETLMLNSERAETRCPGSEEGHALSGDGGAGVGSTTA